jgi:hypothetical protein
MAPLVLATRQIALLVFCFMTVLTRIVVTINIRDLFIKLRHWLRLFASSAQFLLPLDNRPRLSQPRFSVVAPSPRARLAHILQTGRTSLV